MIIWRKRLKPGIGECKIIQAHEKREETRKRIISEPSGTGFVIFRVFRGL